MKRFWVVVFTVTSLLSISFASKLSFKLWDYFSLDTKADALSTTWQVVEKDSSSCALAVFYHFYDGSQLVSGCTEFAKPLFSTAFSAEKAGKQFEKKSWEVFYRSSRSEINSLQKLFPFKEAIQLFLMLGVFVYFFCLKTVVKHQTSMSFFKTK